MRCYYPLSAWQLDSGEVVFTERGHVNRALFLRCGQCVGCRLKRSKDWAIRCVHESKMWQLNCFATFTYSDENVPFSLDYKHFQDFVRRLRKVHKRRKLNWVEMDVNAGDLRFYMSGEYGELTFRPHYHAILFGLDFPDKKFYRIAPGGSRLYVSRTLDRLWGFGQCVLGDVTFESAAYVARYIMKKVTGQAARYHYPVDDLTGEIRIPEFSRMSLKPGIGASFMDKYITDIYPDGKCVSRGQSVNAPKYYDRRYEEFDPEGFEALQFARYMDGLKYSGDSSDARLMSQEIVTKARVGFLKRGIY